MLFKSNEPELVHVSEDYDIYIGRGRCPKTGELGIWGNPYTTKESAIAKYKVKTIEEAVELYREYLLCNTVLMSKLKNLEGLKIACWCKKKHVKTGEHYCHGQIIIEEFRNQKLKENI